MSYGITQDIASPWILAVASFIIALPPAIFIKYSGNELLHHVQKSCTKCYGFKREKYYEARFLMESTSSSKELFEQMQQEFNLGDYGVNVYNDTYYSHSLPAFSERVGTVKEREIRDEIT